MWGEANVPSPQEYIDAAFGQGGYLARHWGSGYQPREGQIALAHAVDRALCGRTHLLSEAPTGTGKSLAYSVPATYHAAMHGKVVVIVTANIALQEQLVSKDLPLLGEILPWAFSFALMKGRNNYLCRSKYEEMNLTTNQQSMFELEQMGASADERDKARLFKWATEQVETREYGDRSDIVGWNPSDKAWRELSVGPDDCRGSKCVFASTCGALAAQRRARECKVVVTNYHMFFTHLRVYLDRGIDVILPPFDAVVFDEAHAAAAVARDFFGWQLGEGSIRRLTRYIRDEHPDLAEKTQRTASWFFSQMLTLRRDRDRYKARIMPQKLNGDDVAAGMSLLDRLGDIRSIVTQQIELFAANPDLVGRAENIHRGVEKALGAVTSILNGGDDNDVLFIEEDEFHKSAQVSCRLVQPAQVLRSALFEKTVVHAPKPGEDEGEGDGEKEVEPQPVSVICTSATLATDSGFKFAAAELGAPSSCEELTVDSPFDYESQALFIIPDVVDPNDDRFTAEVAAVFKRTIELARGRTLGLFTSRKRMNEVYDAVHGRTPFRIMRQDDGQRTQLIAEFKQDIHSVLMGVASFWAGVDVPGESLSVVFIDKLPFPTPDDPVLDRLSETDKRAWAAYAVPRAIIELKQGFGRLIRTNTDKGVVVCCDNRLVTKGYGKQFLRAMPKGMQKIRNLEAIREWLDAPVATEPVVEEVDPFS